MFYVISTCHLLESLPPAGKSAKEKKDQVQNPSGYLKLGCPFYFSAFAIICLFSPATFFHLRKAAVKREASGPPAALSLPASGPDESKIHRRATWLNANVFADRPIDEEAGLGGLDT